MPSENASSTIPVIPSPDRESASVSADLLVPTLAHFPGHPCHHLLLTEPSPRGFCCWHRVPIPAAPPGPEPDDRSEPSHPFSFLMGRVPRQKVWLEGGRPRGGHNHGTNTQRGSPLGELGESNRWQRFAVVVSVETGFCCRGPDDWRCKRQGPTRHTKIARSGEAAGRPPHARFWALHCSQAKDREQSCVTMVKRYFSLFPPRRSWVPSSSPLAVPLSPACLPPRQPT